MAKLNLPKRFVLKRVIKNNMNFIQCQNDQVNNL